MVRASIDAVCGGAVSPKLFAEYLSVLGYGGETGLTCVVKASRVGDYQLQMPTITRHLLSLPNGS